jgi:cytochrome c peroxidase
LTALIVVAAAGGQPAAPAMTRGAARERARALSALGRKLFFDPGLSASKEISCASCHDPAFGYGPSNALAVQRGGKDLQQWGNRAAPSLRYLQPAPLFTEHYFDSETEDDSVDGGPTGGLTWDGRVDRFRDQARIPLLSPHEMANDGPAQVVQSARKASYAPELEKLSPGSDIDTVFATILEALEDWQQDDKEFYPYSSKYDEWLAGKSSLTDSELRGLRLFSDPQKGDCARCHIATRGVNGTPPQFTDYGFVALGAPRNRLIPANRDPEWYDLGLCGPERTDLRERVEYCGRFKTPSLRNVATRSVFFHNGVFHSLKAVLQFYATRDISPEKWYPAGNDLPVVKFDDLPAQYRVNVEMGSPFRARKGSTPLFNDQEMEDIIAFLRTLTDADVRLPPRSPR